MYTLDQINEIILYREEDLSCRVINVVDKSCITTTANLSKDDIIMWQLLFTIRLLKETHLNDPRYQRLVYLLSK